jgi:LysM repeat protein
VHLILPYLLRAFVLFAALLVGSLNLRADIVHRVQRHDTLTSVARQHGVTVSALAARNEMRPTDHLSTGQLIIIPTSKSEPEKVEVEYVVKSGDSLASIAQKFDVTVAALAKRNNIKNPNDIKAGQRLQIPASGISDTPGIGVELKKNLDGISIKPKRWQRIVIHHSGTSLDTVASMDRYHRNERHMENGLAYHFVIGNGARTKDGEIYVGSRWTKQLDGGHLSSSVQNRSSIGICLVGDFNKRAPSEKQIEVARTLVTYLMKRCDLSKRSVQTHRQINVRPTQCPGSKFPTTKFLATLP